MTRLAFAWVATAIIAAVMLPSCTSTPPDLTPVPGQANFAAAAWNRHFHRNDAPPEIEWVRGDDLNCGGGAMFIVDGVCKGGDAIGDFVRLPLPDGKPWWPSICHEFQHAWMYRQHLADPADHSRFDFASVDKCAAEVATLQGEGR